MSLEKIGVANLFYLFDSEAVMHSLMVKGTLIYIG
jgi:hypothetical protein